MEIEKEYEKKLLTLLIIISVGVILCTAIYIYLELRNAKQGCEILEGNYTLTKLQHTCDGKLIYKYSNGEWDYERVDLNKINWSEFNFSG